LLETLTSNLRHKSNPFFEGTALVDEADLKMVTLIRREIAEQGTSFITSANSLLNRSRIKPGRSNAKTPAKCRVGVTVYYFQDDIEGDGESRPAAAYERRKNLQRKHRQAARQTSKEEDREVAKVHT
jgi:hypothetical protein